MLHVFCLCSVWLLNVNSNPLHSFINKIVFSLFDKKYITFYVILQVVFYYKTKDSR